MADSFVFEGRTHYMKDELFLVGEPYGNTGLPYWSQALGSYIASTFHNQEMTDAHWEIGHFVAEYFHEHGRVPMIRILTKQVGKRLGKEKGNTKYLYDLFPGGPAKVLASVMGFPRAPCASGGTILDRTGKDEPVQMQVKFDPKKCVVRPRRPLKRVSTPPPVSIAPPKKSWFHVWKPLRWGLAVSLFAYLMPLPVDSAQSLWVGSGIILSVLWATVVR